MEIRNFFCIDVRSIAIEDRYLFSQTTVQEWEEYLSYASVEAIPLIAEITRRAMARNIHERTDYINKLIQSKITCSIGQNAKEDVELKIEVRRLDININSLPEPRLLALGAALGMVDMFHFK